MSGPEESLSKFAGEPGRKSPDEICANSHGKPARYLFFIPGKRAFPAAHVLWRGEAAALAPASPARCAAGAAAREVFQWNA